MKKVSITNKAGEKLIGIIQNEKDSVKEIKKLREKLSQERIDVDEINKLAD